MAATAKASTPEDMFVSAFILFAGVLGLFFALVKYRAIRAIKVVALDSGIDSEAEAKLSSQDSESVRILRVRKPCFYFDCNRYWSRECYLIECD